jgi:hypothetical protein
MNAPDAQIDLQFEHEPYEINENEKDIPLADDIYATGWNSGCGDERGRG